MLKVKGVRERKSFQRELCENGRSIVPEKRRAILGERTRGKKKQKTKVGREIITRGIKRESQ